MDSTGRILALDIVRGVAVLGILAMNIIAFAQPMQAYINPLAYSAGSRADLAVAGFNFLFIDGRMRGLFSFLFGASMLLVGRMAQDHGRSSSAPFFARQFWLLIFGILHFYLLWFGDILIGYALLGMVAWQFRNRSAATLIACGIGLVTFQLALFLSIATYIDSLSVIVAQPNPPAAALDAWTAFTRAVAVPSAAELQRTMSVMLGPWSGFVRFQLTENLLLPWMFTFFAGWETLGYMLFGMAALKSGFLTGSWDDGRYARTALIALAISIPAYAWLLARLFAENFSVPSLFTWATAATVPVRPVMVVGYAALIILVTRKGGWLVERLAAAGRAAFTNYLGTTLLMTFVFNGWGLGLFGSMSRAELWLVVIAMWVLMLGWSKPWLERYRYGPFEWLWRSLSRLKPQPIRRGTAVGDATDAA